MSSQWFGSFDLVEFRQLVTLDEQRNRTGLAGHTVDEHGLPESALPSKAKFPSGEASEEVFQMMRSKLETVAVEE